MVKKQIERKEQPEPPKTKKARALYRATLSCKIGKDACEGRGIPSGVMREDWVFYQLFSALEEIARALGEDDDE